MPVITRFYGMAIKMYFLGSEHNPPHIHAIYGEYMGAIDIAHEKAHAFAITGYLQNINSGDISRFRVWNPWYDYFETIGLDQVYITDRGDRYEGERYIINW